MFIINGKNTKSNKREVSDVFIIILRAKAVMLSEETAIEKNPTLSVF